MADTLTKATPRDTLTAVYTHASGATSPADDAVWSLDNTAVASLSATSGASVDETMVDASDGKLTPTTVTVSGGGFTASIEVDVQASDPITGIAISTSGPEA